MRAVRSCIVLLGVFFSALALLAPFLTVPAPWGAEVWFFPSVRELGLGLKLAPTLNGMPFTGPGPLAAVLLSLLPFSDLMALRLLNMLLGCLVCMSVFVFCSSLWDIKSGVCSALFTMTTWGFAATFGHLGPSALPACLAVISFLLFAQIYLMELNPWWYLLAYLLAGGAALTGGWVPLTFFALSAVFLVLIDMAPAKFASIKAFWGIVLVGGSMLAVYGACRILEGPALAGSLFSFHQEQGLLARLWLWVKFNLPWLLLAAPAWLYGEGPNEAGAWRSLLAPKTAYASGFAVVLLSGSVQEGYALLGIPFGASSPDTGCPGSSSSGKSSRACAPSLSSGPLSSSRARRSSSSSKAPSPGSPWTLPTVRSSWPSSRWSCSSSCPPGEGPPWPSRAWAWRRSLP